MVVVLEGILVLANDALLAEMDVKIFVDVDDDDRLARRLLRDISHRGRQLGYTLDMCFKYAKPGYDAFIGPSAKAADVIVPRGADNFVAIDLITKHIKSLLQNEKLAATSLETNSQLQNKN